MLIFQEKCLNFAVNEFEYLDHTSNPDDENVDITCTRSRDSDSSIRSCSIILREKNLYSYSNSYSNFSEIKVDIEILFKSIEHR